MNVLILGLGKASTAIRGHQLGGMIGARSRSRLTPEDLAWADLVVLIKRGGVFWAHEVRAAKKPIVWDALDFWLQPEQNAYTKEQAAAELALQLHQIQPVLTIGATQAMGRALDGAYLPHHANPTLLAKPPREVVRIVAYEGVEKYLGRWRNALGRECQRRGWVLLVNPPNLADADLVVAFRDGAHDGWMCQNWKSGVKCVNAIAAGRPLITQPSAAFDEIDPAGCTIEDMGDLSRALDEWAPFVKREAVWKDSATRKEFALPKIAADYKALLERVAVRC
jgi:hypothetical protein